MKAVVQDRYGPPDVLRLDDVPRPVLKDDEILVRVRASTVTQTDTHLRKAEPFIWRLLLGLRRPRWRTLGVEFAGEVEAVGAAVRRFRVGDRVFGRCRYGAHAEFLAVPAEGPIEHLPARTTFEEGAAVCDGGYQGLVNLRRGKVGKGTRLLVYGASGSCGTAAVQQAKHFGAHVTAVCGTKHVDLVRSLGPDEVIDYQREDFTANGERYDVILDAVGKASFRRGRASLVPGGVWVATDGLVNILWALWTWRIGERRVVFAVPRRSREDIELLKRLIEAGEYRPVIDRRYPLEAAAEAHRYVEGWHKAGNVVLVVSPDGAI